MTQVPEHPRHQRNAHWRTLQLGTACVLAIAGKPQLRSMDFEREDEGSEPRHSSCTGKQYDKRSIDDEMTHSLLFPRAKHKASPPLSLEQANNDSITIQNQLWIARRGVLASPSLPWETPWMRSMLGAQPKAYGSSPGTAWLATKNASLPYPDLAVINASPKSPTDRPGVNLNFMSAKARIRFVAVRETDDALRERAVFTWRMIAESDLEATKVGRTLLKLSEQLATNAAIKNSIDDVFATKSTATLVKRGGSILSFVHWARSNNRWRPLLFEEELVYEYVCEIRSQGAAPSKGQSFIQALNFASCLLGSPAAWDAAHSSRVIGACHAMAIAKRPLTQAVPLTVKQVRILESLTSHAPDLADRCASGYMTFCIYACCRFSDPMYASEVKYDLCSGPDGPDGFAVTRGFVEFYTLGHHKTANTVAKKTTFLPLVAHVAGLSQSPWGLAWKRARDEAGLRDDSPPQLPAPGTAKLWTSRRVTTGEGTKWLRHLLVLGGCSQAEADAVSTHSLKCTILSWMSKAGVDIALRRLMGHHSDPAMKSALTYSRDAMAAPLAEVQKVVDAINSGDFRPDDSRAERAFPRYSKPTPSQPAKAEQVHAVQSTVDEADWTVVGDPYGELNPELTERFSNADEAQVPNSELGQALGPEVPASPQAQVDEALAGMTDSSSSDSGSDSDSELSDSEVPDPVKHDAEIACIDTLQAAASPTGVLKGNLYQHSVSGCLHVRSSILTRTMCSRVLSSSYKLLKQQPKYKWPECEQCIAAVAKQSQVADNSASSSGAPAEQAELEETVDLFQEDLN